MDAIIPPTGKSNIADWAAQPEPVAATFPISPSRYEQIILAAIAAEIQRRELLWPPEKRLR